MHHDILNLNRVENDRARLPRPENEAGGHLYRIHRVVVRVIGHRGDAEFPQNLSRVVLDGHLVHQHPAAPGSAAGREFRFIHRHLEARLGEIVRRDEPARPRPDDRHIDREMIL